VGHSVPRISVLLSETDDARFSAYCDEKGHKKSTLISRLIREHLDREGYASQVPLFEQHPRRIRKSEVDKQLRGR
jgi:hypothetical protein